MSGWLLAFVTAISALGSACGGGSGNDPRAAGDGVTSRGSPRTVASADGRSDEPAPLSEDELGRLLDALEREIDDR